MNSPLSTLSGYTPIADERISAPGDNGLSAVGGLTEESSLDALLRAAREAAPE